jgi:hypothetical protein
VQKIETRIEIRLPGEGVVLEGTVVAVNHGKRKRPAWRQTVRWRCLCEEDIDTGAMPQEALQLVTGGYVLIWPRCGRWYMHHCGLGYVEGGSPTDKAK